MNHARVQAWQIFLQVVVGLLLTAGSVSAETTFRTVEDLEPWRGLIVTDITLAGNHVTRDWVIAREIWTDVGQPFDPEVVAGDIIRLENLAIFGSVEVTPRRDGDGVALDFVFTEMPWIIPYPSISYTEENGFSAGLGVTSPNFGGRGVRSSASAVFGGTTTARFKAENPWITGNHVSAGFEVLHQTRTNKLLGFRQTSDRVALSGGKYIGDTGRLNVGGGYYGVGSDQPDITLDPDNHDEIWYGGGSIGMDSRDSWRVPHSGWHNELQAAYVGGVANSWSTDFDVVRYQPLGERHTLAGGPLLSLQSGQVGMEVPSHLQYFLGGANSVRGYELEKLGLELYGKNQLLFNLEYRLLLLPVSALKIFKWSVGVGIEAAAFADAGVVWSAPADLNLDRSRFGYGAGLRLLLPGVEMVRFDLGISETGDTVFNFGVNSIFSDRKKRIR